MRSGVWRRTSDGNLTRFSSLSPPIECGCELVTSASVAGNGRAGSFCACWISNRAIQWIVDVSVQSSSNSQSQNYVVYSPTYRKLGWGLPSNQRIKIWKSPNTDGLFAQWDAGTELHCFRKNMQRYATTGIPASVTGVKAVPIHGQLSQSTRLGALNKFRSGDRNILVATDVASRGLDMYPSPLLHIQRIV